MGGPGSGSIARPVDLPGTDSLFATAVALLQNDIAAQAGAHRKGRRGEGFDGEDLKFRGLDSSGVA